MPVPNLLNGKLCCICLKSCLRSGKCGQVCKSLLFIFMGPGYIQMMLRLGRHCGACSERPRVGMFIHIFKKDWQEAIGECVYIYTKVKALVFLRCLDGMQHVLSCMPYNLDLLKVIQPIFNKQSQKFFATQRCWLTREWGTKWAQCMDQTTWDKLSHAS